MFNCSERNYLTKNTCYCSILYIYTKNCSMYIIENKWLIYFAIPQYIYCGHTILKLIFNLFSVETFILFYGKSKYFSTESPAKFF